MQCRTLILFILLEHCIFSKIFSLLTFQFYLSSFFQNFEKKLEVSALDKWIFLWGPKNMSALDSVRFTVSALERFFKVKKYRNRPGPNVGVRLNQVSALEHVRFRQV